MKTSFPSTDKSTATNHSTDISILNASTATNGALQLPVGNGLLEAEFTRSGNDLHITTPGEAPLLVRSYFTMETPVNLLSAQGKQIAGNAVEILAGNPAAAQYAGDVTAGKQAIGIVEKLSGKVIAIRGGEEIALSNGDYVFQNDVIKTGSEGMIGITFEDGSVFTLGSDARMTLDSLVYDADTGEGSSSVSVIKGMFKFISGDIAANNPGEMQIHTPVATIGIRGTTGGGSVEGEGEQNEFYLEPNADGTVGWFDVITNSGVQPVNQPNSMVELSSINDVPPPPEFVPPAVIQQKFAEVINFAPPGKYEARQNPENQQNDQQPQENEGEKQPAADAQQGEGEGEGEAGENADKKADGDEAGEEGEEGEAGEEGSDGEDGAGAGDDGSDAGDEQSLSGDDGDHGDNGGEDAGDHQGDDVAAEDAEGEGEGEGAGANDATDAQFVSDDQEGTETAAGDGEDAGEALETFAGDEQFDGNIGDGDGDGEHGDDGGEDGRDGEGEYHAGEGDDIPGDVAADGTELPFPTGEFAEGAEGNAPDGEQQGEDVPPPPDGAEFTSAEEPPADDLPPPPADNAQDNPPPEGEFQSDAAHLPPPPLGAMPAFIPTSAASEPVNSGFNDVPGEADFVSQDPNTELAQAGEPNPEPDANSNNPVLQPLQGDATDPTVIVDPLAAPLPPPAADGEEFLPPPPPPDGDGGDAGDHFVDTLIDQVQVNPELADDTPLPGIGDAPPPPPPEGDVPPPPPPDGDVPPPDGDAPPPDVDVPPPPEGDDAPPPATGGGGGGGATTAAGMTLTVTSAADALYGDAGDDQFIISNTADVSGDTLDGAAGMDKLVFDSNVSAGSSFLITDPAQISNIESLSIGSNFNTIMIDDNYVSSLQSKQFTIENGTFTIGDLQVQNMNDPFNRVLISGSGQVTLSSGGGRVGSATGASVNIAGGSGDDEIHIDGGTSTVSGGAGNNFINVEGGTAHTISSGTGAGEQFVSIENATSSTVSIDIGSSGMGAVKVDNADNTSISLTGTAGTSEFFVEVFDSANVTINGSATEDNIEIVGFSDQVDVTGNGGGDEYIFSDFGGNATLSTTSNSTVNDTIEFDLLRTTANIKINNTATGGGQTDLDFSGGLFHDGSMIFARSGNDLKITDPGGGNVFLNGFFNGTTSDMEYRLYSERRFEHEIAKSNQNVSSSPDMDTRLLSDSVTVSNIALTTDPFQTTNGSAVVTVTQEGHGLSAGDKVSFSGGTTPAVNGIDLTTGQFTVTSVVDGNTYKITAGSNATATGAGGSSGVLTTVENIIYNDIAAFTAQSFTVATDSVPLAFGGGGDDSIVGAAGSTGNIIHGLDGEDTITGFDNDTVYGDAGNDTFNKTSDVYSVDFDGGSGFDIVDYSGTIFSSVSVTLTATTNNSTVNGGMSYDTLSNIEGIIGTTGADSVVGASGSTVVNYFEGGMGADTFTGGTGGAVNTISYMSSSAGVSVDIAANSYSGGDAAGDVISGVQNIIGSAFADTITGDGGGNVIYGEGGDDSITGGSGSDTMIGGGGNDTIEASADSSQDVIILDDNLGGMDIINGFQATGAVGQQDVIALDGLLFYSSGNDHADDMNYFDLVRMGALSVTDDGTNSFVKFDQGVLNGAPSGLVTIAQINGTTGVDWKNFMFGDGDYKVGGGIPFNGTDSTDVLIANAVSQINGLDGNDVLYSSGVSSSYYGGNGDDVLIINSASLTNVIDGGEGRDTLLLDSGIGSVDASSNLQSVVDIEVLDLGGNSITNLSADTVTNMTFFDNTLFIDRDDATTETVSIESDAGWTLVTAATSLPQGAQLQTGYTTYTASDSSGELAIVHIQNA